MSGLAIGNLPFEEQAEFFRQKLNVPTEGWRDLLKADHDHAFMVAGAAKADLLADLRQAVNAAVLKGETLQQFRARFDDIVSKHGWDYKGPRNWRTRVIYRTNMSTSYAAGRLQQLVEAGRRGLLWMYRHSDSVLHPRPLHVSWNGLTLSPNHNWWKTHYPPNGWGCHCYVVAVHPDDVARRGGRLESPPDDGTDIATGSPAGIDEGWDYQPGRSRLDALGKMASDKVESLAARDLDIARIHTTTLRDSGAFANWFGGATAGEWPVAVLDEAMQAAISAESPVVLLSRPSFAAHMAKHPEIKLDDYLQIQQILDQGEVYQLGDERLVYIQIGEVTYRAALKRTQDGKKNYFLTLFLDEKGKPPLGTVRVR